MTSEEAKVRKYIAAHRAQGPVEVAKACDVSITTAARLISQVDQEGGSTRAPILSEITERYDLDSSELFRRFALAFAALSLRQQLKRVNAERNIVNSAHMAAWQKAVEICQRRTAKLWEAAPQLAAIIFDKANNALSDEQIMWKLCSALDIDMMRVASNFLFQVPPATDLPAIYEAQLVEEAETAAEDARKERLREQQARDRLPAHLRAHDR